MTHEEVVVITESGAEVLSTRAPQQMWAVSATADTVVSGTAKSKDAEVLAAVEDEPAAKMSWDLEALLWLKDLALVLGILYLLYRDLLMRLRQPLPCEPTSAPSTAGTADGDKNISTLAEEVLKKWDKALTMRDRRTSSVCSGLSTLDGGSSTPRGRFILDDSDDDYDDDGYITYAS